MTQPSKFIFNSDYASLKNDDLKTFSIVIPPNFTVPADTAYTVVSQEFTIGQKAAGMRVIAKSNKSGSYIIPDASAFQIPATATLLDFGGQVVPSALYVNVHRSAPGKIKIVVVPNMGAGMPTRVAWSDCGQTITFSVATYLSPFSS